MAEVGHMDFGELVRIQNFDVSLMFLSWDSLIQNRSSMLTSIFISVL